jgi:cytochrome c biogenesis protein
MGLKSVWTKIYQTLSSVKTGICLILLAGVFSAIGTVILQRPTTEPDVIQRSYTPETLAWLDRLGLTDIFHAGWFLALLCMFCVCLIFVSVDRWPKAWNVYAKPVRFATAAFRASLPQTVTFPVAEPTAALSIAGRVLARFGYKAERVSENGQTCLFAEKQKFSVFAVYIVHMSLLCIFAGYIVDAVVGYRGNVMVPEGEARNQITMLDNRGGESKKTLPFFIRCDGAGEETYADGSPKKWWSKLTLLEDGKEVAGKTIIVNDPLTYKGIRLYQASMGQSGTPKTLMFEATPTKGGDAVMVEVPLKGKAALPDGESLSILRWVPDYYIQDNQVFQKSDQPENPAIQLGVTSAKGDLKKAWILYREANTTQGQDSPYVFVLKQASWSQYTGLEVSHQPGQFGVWIGVVLMAIGLVIAFYTQHSRVWAMVIDDGQGGKILWTGGTTNKNRDRFQVKFEQIKAALQAELGVVSSDSKEKQNTLTQA